MPCKQKQSEFPGESSSSEKPDSSKPSEVKRCKNRSAPDPKWMDNGNDAWLEYREVNGILVIFCRWCESKKYTNELAKGTSNYRKQSIDRHLNHHEHKTEAEVRRNQNIIRVDFSQMEEAIVYVIEKALCEEIRSSNHWSIMIDETNSITDEKHLAVMSQHISHNSFIIAKGLKVENLLHFGSDGAATLIGIKTGVVKRFEKINPFITSVHCIAHRLHLVRKDAVLIDVCKI
ncbi:hypothetical protein C1646_769180 [Rhizophagus diaphanus]|nr:hypothetical protein C1646_769180 [Rhizophagus diaphanus] [Rhizophagus sp. MUCL 43196]